MRIRYEDGEKIASLSRAFKLSPARVGRIVKVTSKYCEKHTNRYYSKCFFCTKGNSLEKFLNSEAFRKMKKTIETCGDRDRDVKTIAMRKKLVKTLKNKYGISFSKIGKLLSRTHTTIAHNYYAS